MKVVIDTQSGSVFSIDVDFWDTVLTIKQKIEKSQEIPVFKQILFFQGKVLQDYLHYFEFQYLHNSRLLLSISPDDNTNQNNNDKVHVPQTEQYSSAPLNPIDEFVNNQGWPVMSNNDQVLQTEESPLTVESWKEFLGVQDSPEGRTNQVLHQTEQSPLPSNSFGETIYSGDRALTTEQVCKNQLDELLGPQDFPPVTAGSKRNRNQVVQTEPSPSDSVKEIPIILDSAFEKKIKTIPMNMTVMVQPFEETRMIPVEVNARDNVEKVKKELAKMQERGELNLPERYFFIHKQAVLDEDQSFWWNGVAHGDTIEIFRGYVTNDQSQLHNQRWRPNINRA